MFSYFVSAMLVLHIIIINKFVDILHLIISKIQCQIELNYFFIRVSIQLVSE